MLIVIGKIPFTFQYYACVLFITGEQFQIFLKEKKVDNWPVSALHLSLNPCLIVILSELSREVKKQTSFLSLMKYCFSVTLMYCIPMNGGKSVVFVASRALVFIHFLHSYTHWVRCSKRHQHEFAFILAKIACISVGQVASSCLEIVWLT